MTSSNSVDNFINPNSLSLKPLSSQVAGHAASVYTSDDDRFVVKKSLKKEIDFYNQIKSLSSSDNHDPHLTDLFKYLPDYQGQTFIPSTDPQSEAKEEAIVIENLTSSKKFSRPNTLDIKLGTQLWDEDDATEEKKLRMDKVSKATTSGETGMRLTGWQTRSTTAPTRIVSTPKSFGKSISSQHLSTGLRLFFCIPNTDDASVRQSILSFAKPDPKDQSSSTLSSEQASSQLLQETSNPPQLNQTYIRLLLKLGLLPALIEIRNIFEKLECRMRGGSLLIIFEGDAQVLEQRVKDFLEETSDLPGLKPGQEKNQDASKRNQEENGLRRLIDVRIIDFAHFKFCKGQGIDEGVLKGINSTIALVEGILKDLEE